MFTDPLKAGRLSLLMEINKELNIKIGKLPHSEVELEGELSTSLLERYQKGALTHLREHVKVPGFREGKVPDDILIAKICEIAVLEETAELAFKELIPKAFDETKLHPIGRPEILITKLVPGNAVTFKVKCAVIPEVKLADYKKIASGVMSQKDEPLEVTEKEISDVIENVRKSRAKKTEGGPEKKDVPAENLPVFDDAFVKTIGDFKTVADFKEKIKINLLEEKKQRAKEKKRITMSDRLTKESEMELPEILVQSELEKMWTQFENDVARFGIALDDYLKHAKKDKEGLQKEWHPDAEKNARLQLIINKIAAVEKIQPDPKSVEHEVKHLMEHYKDADPGRAQIYVETMFTNEAVFTFLEKQK